ncbi:unnamed protein product [Malus baccata var. baccata]
MTKDWIFDWKCTFIHLLDILWYYGVKIAMRYHKKGAQSVNQCGLYITYREVERRMPMRRLDLESMVIFCKSSPSPNIGLHLPFTSQPHNTKVQKKRRFELSYREYIWGPAIPVLSFQCTVERQGSVKRSKFRIFVWPPMTK